MQEMFRSIWIGKIYTYVYVSDVARTHGINLYIVVVQVGFFFWNFFFFLLSTLTADDATHTYILKATIED